MTLRTGEKGFTLLELLAVMGIIIIIAASIFTIIPGIREKTQKKATKAFMERLEITIEQYYDDNRIYPSTGIAALKATLHPSNATSKRYIEFDSDEVDGDNIVDEWGNPFVYSQPGTSTHNTATTYDLYSTGSDGVTSSSGGDADDINNWSR